MGIFPTLALRHRGALLGRSLRTIRANLDLLDAFFARHAEFLPLAGVCLLFLASPFVGTGDRVIVFPESARVPVVERPPVVSSEPDSRSRDFTDRLLRIRLPRSRAT